MQPTDHPVNNAMAQVGADLFKRIGLNVDIQAMDAGTMFQRRANRESVDNGGWSVFPSMVGGADALNPAVSFLTRGNGANAWYGWPTIPALETERSAWFDAPDLPAQQGSVQPDANRRAGQRAAYSAGPDPATDVIPHDRHRRARRLSKVLERKNRLNSAL